MMLLANYVNATLENNFKISKYYQKEHGLAMMIGIAGGVFAQSNFSDIQIKDFLFGQALLFKLFLMPIVLYEV